jgi:hypothetical protein
LAGGTAGRHGDPAVVVQQEYDLALWVVRKVEKFPRSFRFSVELAGGPDPLDATAGKSGWRVRGLPRAAVAQRREDFKATVS